jgi:hypothetical protein
MLAHSGHRLPQRRPQCEGLCLYFFRSDPGLHDHAGLGIDGSQATQDLETVEVRHSDRGRVRSNMSIPSWPLSARNASCPFRFSMVCKRFRMLASSSTKMLVIMSLRSYDPQTSSRGFGCRLRMRELVPLLPQERLFVQRRFSPKTPAT